MEESNYGGRLSFWDSAATEEVEEEKGGEGGE